MTAVAPAPLARPVEALRVAVLGLHLWWVVGLSPALRGAGPWRGAHALLAVPPLIMLAGALALGRGRRGPHPDAVRAALLAGVPMSLAIALGVLSGPALPSPGPAALALSAASALAYGAMAAHATARPDALRATTVTPLGTPLVEVDSARRVVLRRTVLGLVLAAGIVASVVAPAASSPAALRAAWPGAADEARVLSAVVGATASALALAAIVGPRLRSPRATPPRRSRTTRVTAALTFALVLFAAYLALRTLDPGDTDAPDAPALLE